MIVTNTDGSAQNFDDGIHKADYLTRFGFPKADWKTAIDMPLGISQSRSIQSLDGDWHFQIDPYDNCLRSSWWEEKYTDDEGRPVPVDFSFDEWETVPVPSTWNTLKPEWLWYEGSVVYFREFSDDNADIDHTTDSRVFLRFGAASYAAYVFLNGEYIGCHKGASTPFSFEITGKVKKVNRLVVVVNDKRSTHNVPMENTDWFNYGGLHREVSLIHVPTSFIRTTSVSLRPDETFSTIDVSVEVDSIESGLPTSARISIPELGIESPIKLSAISGSKMSGSVTSDSASARLSGSVSLTAPMNLQPGALQPGTLQLWSPQNPKLYDVRIELGDTDIWQDRIGFRQISVMGTDILLNGKPLFLKGISQHEESVTHGRTLTEAEIRENISLAKQMGCNYIRLAHYPHNELTARLADEYGMMLWEEVPVYWAIDFDSPAVFEDAHNQLCELISRDSNRASVIIWSVGNENADTDSRLSFMSRLVDTCHELDSTRLVSAACLVSRSEHGPVIADRLAEKLDIIGVNEYYGWYSPNYEELTQLFKNSQPSKPVIVTEFGADAVSGKRGTVDELYTEDHQLDVYQKQIEVFSTTPYINGTSPWILYDFRCPRRTAAIQGFYNRKGLVSADKTYKKPAFYAMRNWYLSIGQED